jgi:transcriptional regulator with XRE-family HTH domain
MAEDTFGARLKRLREDAGLTQQELADRSGLSKSNMAKLEQDQYNPTWPTVQALAKALKLSCTAFEGTVEATPETRTPGTKGRPKSKPASEEPAPEPSAEQPAKKRKRKES